jgi:hypothetical protein
MQVHGPAHKSTSDINWEDDFSQMEMKWKCVIHFLKGRRQHAFYKNFQNYYYIPYSIPPSFHDIISIQKALSFHYEHQIIWNGYCSE